MAGASDVQAQYESLKTKYRVSLSQSRILQCIPILSPILNSVYTLNFRSFLCLTIKTLFDRFQNQIEFIAFFGFADFKTTMESLTT